MVGDRSFGTYLYTSLSNMGRAKPCISAANTSAFVANRGCLRNGSTLFADRYGGIRSLMCRFGSPVFLCLPFALCVLYDVLLLLLLSTAVLNTYDTPIEVETVTIGHTPPLPVPSHHQGIHCAPCKRLWADCRAVCVVC